MNAWRSITININLNVISSYCTSKIVIVINENGNDTEVQIIGYMEVHLDNTITRRELSHAAFKFDCHSFNAAITLIINAWNVYPMATRICLMTNVIIAKYALWDIGIISHELPLVW